MAVHDRAAAGGHDRLADLLAGRGTGELAALQRAELQRAQARQQDQAQEEREEKADAAFDQDHQELPLRGRHRAAGGGGGGGYADGLLSLRHRLRGLSLGHRRRRRRRWWWAVGWRVAGSSPLRARWLPPPWVPRRRCRSASRRGSRWSWSSEPRPRSGGGAGRRRRQRRTRRLPRGQRGRGLGRVIASASAAVIRLAAAVARPRVAAVT